MSYIVYMALCANNSVYTGITTDTERRLKQHNGELPGGAAYTRSCRPVELRYTEKCPNKGAALKREAIIKKLTHAEKMNLIKQKTEK